MSIRRSLTWACIGLIGMLSLTGCPPKKKLALEPKKQEQSPAKEEAKAKEPTEIQINQDWTEIPQLEDIHFEFDKANLSDAGRADLKKNVALIKKLPSSIIIRVDGNCDSRGTVEYNIALGQRRANVVRSYYAAAGILKHRIETISFGHEHPICREETEECWAQNRRSGTKVKNKEPIAINLKTLDTVGSNPGAPHTHGG